VGRPPGDNSADCQTKTLADVIFANKAKTRVSESLWVGLVQAIAAGDQRALHALYTQTHRMVFTLNMRITGSRETAEELTLDVFHDVWRRASTYDPAGGPVIGWILNQTRSRAIDRARFEHRKKRVADPAISPVQAAPVSDAHEALEAGEQGERLRQALEVLTAHEREAVETAFFSELTYEEVAQKLSQPLGTVKTRIRSALTKLRQVLGERDRT
jgi:RNA polymerase sigma-70 factor, ECF subfamily